MFAGLNRRPVLAGCQRYFREHSYLSFSRRRICHDVWVKFEENESFSGGGGHIAIKRKSTIQGKPSQTSGLEKLAGEHVDEEKTKWKRLCGAEETARVRARSNSSVTIP